MSKIRVGLPGQVLVGPQGQRGEKGDPFNVNATGTLAGRSAYNGAAANFAYFATDTGLLYFKASATSGDWTTGIPFGKGDQGDPGAQAFFVQLQQPTEPGPWLWLQPQQDGSQRLFYNDGVG